MTKIIVRPIIRHKDGREEPGRRCWAIRDENGNDCLGTIYDKEKDAFEYDEQQVVEFIKNYSHLCAIEVQQ